MSTKRLDTPTRAYRKRRRAEQEEETRLRITEATVELHGTVGPARTTVKAIAERAGVQRATVYRHFPDEPALYQACSSHWRAQHPLPDVARWMAIEDPRARLRTALDELYGWYETASPMLERTTRDAPLVPALQPSVTAFAGAIESIADTLAQGWPARRGRRAVVRAAIAHALAFATWRSLTVTQQLDRAVAVELMAGLADVAGGASAERRARLPSG